MVEFVVFQCEVWQVLMKELFEKVIVDGVEVIYFDKGLFVEVVKFFYDSLCGIEIGVLIE